MIEGRNDVKSLRTAKIGIFAALYVVTSLIPISIFIGAPSFLALNLIITPIMALLLSPLDAFVSSLIGGLIGLYIAPAQAMFGVFSILLPIAGATFGSYAYHEEKMGNSIAGVFLIFSILAYLIRNYSFPYFVAPHLVALCVVLIAVFRKIILLRWKIPLYAFVATMCEQGMMMVFAVHLLGLPWQVFTGILPIMLYERIVGTVGAFLIVLSLNRVSPELVNLRLRNAQ